ncbi:hypothetical protein JOM56_012725 [Amanita muscaria]
MCSAASALPVWGLWHIAESAVARPSAPVTHTAYRIRACGADTSAVRSYYVWGHLALTLTTFDNAKDILPDLPTNPTHTGEEVGSPTTTVNSVEGPRKRSLESTTTTSEAQPPVKRARRGKPPAQEHTMDGDAITACDNVQDKSDPTLKARGLRENRNKHPGAIDCGPTRWTKAQVAADRKSEQERQHQLDKLEAEKKAVLARMMHQADEAAMAELNDVVTRISQMTSNLPGDCSATDSSSNEPASMEKKAKGTKGRKERGQLRNAIDEMVVMRTAAAAADVTEKIVKNKSGKKPSSLPPANGLAKGWEKKSGGANDNGSREVTIKSSGLGGLADMDAQARRPPFPIATQSPDLQSPRQVTVPKKWRRKANIRQNEMVTTSTALNSGQLTDTDDDNLVMVPSRKLERTAAVIFNTQPTKSQTRTKKKPSKTHREALPPQRPGRKATAPSSINISTSEDDSDVAITSVEGAAVTLALPNWITIGWRKQYLPTLYYTLTTSTQPFSDFAKGADNFLPTVQQVINSVYPMAKYKVTPGDAIYTTSLKRLNEFKSKLGREARSTIQKYIEHKFDERDFEGIQEWATYALRPNGPAWHTKPTPIECTVKRNAPGYIQEHGFCESKFIINTMSVFCKLIAGTSGLGEDTKYPVGLLGLTLTALERALRSYTEYNPKSKKWGTLNDFSNENWSGTLSGWMANIERLSARRWDSILALCDVTKTKKKELCAKYEGDFSLLEANRSQIYIPSSP